MNETIMRKAGFGKEIDAVKRGECPLCGHKTISYAEFRDWNLIKKFQISGICQKCQDRVFGK